ncbi:uncharacterized protein LOC117171958 [Belonocnema kinseyi]|uniref:uncharacterized protein LOC117171958 n=1 Tax=Belonocnema kinseyi TaxID=2817044 RepID=UPI00143D6D6B|nr:uncharacterized protein LOC117171958 [Belonocnema kinseyi]
MVKHKINAAFGEQLIHEANLAAHYWASTTPSDPGRALIVPVNCNLPPDRLALRRQAQNSRIAASPDFRDCQSVYSEIFAFLPDRERDALSRHIKELTIREGSSSPESRSNALGPVSSDTPRPRDGLSSVQSPSAAETIEEIDSLLRLFEKQYPG